MSLADLVGLPGLLDEPDTTCSWCGKISSPDFSVDACLCGMCRKCGFMHDAGPCRSGVVLLQARWSKDNCVHTIQWMNNGRTIVIPTCYDQPAHSKPWPGGLGFSETAEPVDCIRCLAEQGSSLPTHSKTT